jgi:hypothetical protein
MPASFAIFSTLAIVTGRLPEPLRRVKLSHWARRASSEGYLPPFSLQSFQRSKPVSSPSHSWCRAIPTRIQSSRPMSGSSPASRVCICSTLRPIWGSRPAKGSSLSTAGAGVLRPKRASHRLRTVSSASAIVSSRPHRSMCGSMLPVKVTKPLDVKVSKPKRVASAALL